MLAEKGLITLTKEIFIDGTKVEANANRYTFVWAKGIKTQQKKLQKQLDELWAYAEQVAKQELQASPPPSIEKIDAKTMTQTIHTINEALKGNKEVDKKLKTKLSKAKREWPARIEKYKRQEEILNGRGSYSKTDPDATFMRSKNDHLGKGQLKPAYNYQIATTKQYITHYSIHQTLADVVTLVPLLKSYQSTYGLLPSTVVADAGYGSEENYHALSQQGVSAYIKYGRYEQEKQKKWQERHPFEVETLHHDPRSDTYYCPTGQKMPLRSEQRSMSSKGYVSKFKRYEAANCARCPLRGLCHRSKGNRIISVNETLNTYRQKVRERLSAQQGQELYKHRSVEVESVFGNIKRNMACRRLLLRGQEKVALELGLISLGHNLRKMLKQTSNTRKKELRRAA